MKNYSDLILNGVVNFEKVLISNYKKIGLDEVDCVLLLKLHENVIIGKKTLDVNKLSKSMTLTKDLISERVVKLINDDVLTLELLEMKGPEILSLEPLYRKLGFVLENKEIKQEKKEAKDDAKDIAIKIENELNRVLSPADIQLIRKWIYEYKYTKEDIEIEILNAKKYKNRGIKYIDSCLYKKYNQTQESLEENTMELFKKVYAKR